MKDINGKQRVVITNVSPEINCGRYSAKRVVGEPFTVHADIFGDGHDEVKGVLLYRETGKRKWEEIPMKFLGNDRWAASFTPEKQKAYEYTIQGWVDHFSTWQHDLKKKFEANQDVATELLIGAEMIEATAERAPAAEKKKIKDWVKQLKKPKSSATAVMLAISDEVSKAMKAWGERTEASQYEKVLKVKVERQKALFSAWYEFFPRSASPKKGKHGTFKDCEHVLTDIAAMGFDVVYFPPIHSIGESFRKGKNNNVSAQPGEPGSPWAIGSKEGGHKAIHPELGTMKDFERLVKKAEKLGIQIALDLALQCSPDHPYVKEHPQWFKWRPDGTVQYAENPPKKYQDILPIYFESEDWKNLWKELKSIVDFWAEKGVRIFRVDNPHTKPFAFWEWLISEVHKDNPDIIFLAEAFTRPRVMEQLAKVGFTQSYTYFTWRNTKEELAQYMKELTQTEQREYFRPNFWPNTPDILPEYLQKGGESAFITRVVLAATLSSNYGLYGPVYEEGINEPLAPGKEEYLNAEKYEIKDWDFKKPTRIREVITRLNEIRKENPALHTTWNIEIMDTDNPQLFAYAKWDDAKDNLMVMVVNLDPFSKQSGWVRVPLYKLGVVNDQPYTMHDQMDGSRYSWNEEWNYVELHPEQMPAHIFKMEDIPFINKKKVEKKEEVFEEMTTH